MDPISAGLGIVGLGMQVFGAISGAQSSRQAASLNQGIARDEMAINEQRRQAMELSASRQQLEIYRHTQRLRAQAQQAGVNQGAQFGSGVPQGMGQVESQGAFNALGVGQNLEIGRNIFGINNDISNKKIQLADVQADQATAAGWQSLGGSLMKAGPMLGAMSQGFGRSSSGSSGSYGNNYGYTANTYGNGYT